MGAIFDKVLLLLIILQQKDRLYKTKNKNHPLEVPTAPGWSPNSVGRHMSHRPPSACHLHSIPLSHPSTSSPWKGSWLPAMSQWTPAHASGLSDRHFLSPSASPWLRSGFLLCPPACSGLAPSWPSARSQITCSCLRPLHHTLDSLRADTVCGSFLLPGPPPSTALM